MKRIQQHLPLVGILLLLSVSCAHPLPDDPRMVSIWMRSLYGAVRAERLSPPVASRLFAYASVALYTGLASAGRSLPSLAGTLNGYPAMPLADDSKPYDRTVVAVAAERTTLDSLFREGLPSTRSALAQLADSLIGDRVKQGVDSATRSRSEALGRRVGAAIVQWAHGDGFDSTRNRPYTSPKGKGLWVNDAPPNWFATHNLSGASEFIALDNPANKQRGGSISDRELILNRPKTAGSGTLPAVNMAGVTEPYWGDNRPFVLKTWNECPAAKPPPFSTTPGSPMYQDAMEVATIHKTLTPEQRQTALYWADNPAETGTPAGHWLSIAAQVIAERHLNADQAASVMVLTSTSLADAFIAVWGYKFQMNLLRPRPYIRAVIDSTWEPAIPSPPFPEYMAGHSAISAAAARALTAMVGDVAFDDSTHLAIGHPVRHFASFTDAAKEAGMSRVYGGIHFPSGNRVGRTVGECVGGKITERLSVIVAIRH